MWKLFTYGKIKSGRKLTKKNRNKKNWKKNRFKEERKSTILSRKEKNPLWSHWCWRSSTLASRFRAKKSPSNLNFSNIMLKTRFPFIYASISRDTKTLTIASIRCLASQQIFRLSIFSAGFFFAFGNFARYCVVLLNTPLSDRDKKKKKFLSWFTLPAKSWSSVSDARRSHHPIGGEIISWRGASCLRTFTNELKSRVWFWDEYIRFERIYRVYRFDRFSSNFAKTFQE